MVTGIDGIDHAVIQVRDLDRAEHAFRRLGFKLTPRGFHTKLDTANHCIMLNGDYFELLGVVRPSPNNASYREALAQREGLSMIALRTRDARAAVAGLEAAGLGPSEAVDFARPVNFPGGRREARFTVVHLDPGRTPGARMFLCQHHTPDLVWLVDAMGHANGAEAISHVTVFADDPVSVAKAYGSIFDAEPEKATGGMRVRAGTAAIVVLSRAAAADSFRGDDVLKTSGTCLAALALRVSHRRDTAQFLKAAGVPMFESASGGIRIPSNACNGVAIDFV
jgi:catechol 2,3-dioxygenase-like lactoylglutathione lyase family enzyme